MSRPRSAPMRSRPLRAARLSSAILTPAALAALAPPALATHEIDSVYRTNAYYSPCRSSTLDWKQNCLTDNVTLTVFRQSSVGDQGWSEIRTVLGRFDTLDLNVKYHSSGVYTGDSETDIIYQRGDIPSGSAGASWCEGATDNWFCDQAYNRFRVEVNLGLACHESGHAVGLVHPVNATYSGSGQQAFNYNSIVDNPNGGSGPMGCMQTPVPPDNGGHLGTLNRHNIDAEYEGASASSAGAYPPYKE